MNKIYRFCAFCQGPRLWAIIPSFFSIDLAIPALPPDLQTNNTSLPFSVEVFDFKIFKGMFLLWVFVKYVAARLEIGRLDIDGEKPRAVNLENHADAARFFWYM